ncbi:MAG: SDR family oxidoreductase [Ktedonobacteraceae bacterium]
MKIAITGGAGFIGSHLTKAYLDAGHDVFVIDNLLHGAHSNIDVRARFYHVDIRDSKVGTILQAERPDVVSHHAAHDDDGPMGNQVMADADIHVRGLLNVLRGCIDAFVKKFIFASGSHSMYGKVDSKLLPLDEDAPLHPQSAHDISQITGEYYVRHYTLHYGLQHTILRYASVYGAAEHTLAPHPANYFITMLLREQRPVISGSGNEIRDHVFIDDVVQANLLALRSGKNCTLHISSGRGCTLNQLYHMIAALLESKLHPLYTAEPRLMIPAITLDNDRARLLLGWHPRFTLSAGIQRTAQHLQECKELLTSREQRERYEVKKPVNSAFIHA